MKLTDLYEDKTQYDLAFSIVQKKCQPFLEQCGGKAIFRGMKYTSDYLQNPVRQDRRPSSTPTFVHHAIDDWFDDRFGIKARSNAMFATGDFRIAGHYGGNLQKVYAVFPIGDFKFVWSRQVGDLFLEIEEVLFNDYDGDEPARKLDDDDLKNDIWEFLDSKDYQPDHLSLAIGSKNEVMIACKEYIAMRVESAAEGNNLVKKLMQEN